MHFDVYYPFTNKDGKRCPGVKPVHMDWNDIKEKILKSAEVRDLVDQHRAGKEGCKIALPSINFVGISSGTRKASAMRPTNLFMIDIDHCDKPREAWDSIKSDLKKVMTDDWFVRNVIIAHVSPGGHGLHLIFKVQGKPTLKENMDYLDSVCHFDQYGEYDTKVKDFSRVSFAFPIEDLLYESVQLYSTMPVEFPYTIENPDFVDASEERKEKAGKAKEQNAFEDVDPFTPTEKAEFETMEYRGVPVKLIVEKYVEVMGEPTSGEIHNYYNEMVKNFRCITSNNKRCLLYLLPRFGHSLEECQDQIKSICRVNTLSRLPKEFYFFLKDNGYYQAELSPKNSQLREYMLSEEEKKADRPPYLPPVFRELVGTAPNDFIVPCINALLPILGTLTSYVYAVYPYDDREHTTSFFSIIYAPPGTGKGFVERFQDLLFKDLQLRDYVQSERENVYLRKLNKKGDNEQSPDMPHTSLRIIPPKNSEAEFLQKQKDNHGYHMFTYAAEMDSWAKGVRAAGGNKDDMIRIAWDNGEYGQQFKSASTFKGKVKLFWNVLITGTLQQIESYFKNVENGLVTRCSFCSIDNQEFVEAPKWRKMTKRGLEVVYAFTERCDRNTYTQPCTIDPDLLETISDDEFDKKIDWRFTFKKKQKVDMSWIMPTIDQFHKEQMAKGILDIDHARDVFRRRVGVRGFRLGLLCTCLWERPTRQQLEKCKAFIRWWMEKDLENMLSLWGQKYNDQADVAPQLTQRSVFDKLPDTFENNDVYAVCLKQGIKTPIRNIIYSWKKIGQIEKVGKNQYVKKKKS